MTNQVNVKFSQLFPVILEKMQEGASYQFTAFGNSMKPYIKGGIDCVTLSPIVCDIKKNDIVFYRREDGSFVLHRIIKVLPDHTYLLCGDNQFNLEPGITREQIFSILSNIERNGKSRSLHSLFSRLWCGMLPVRRLYLHVKSSTVFQIRKLIQKQQ